MSIIFYENGEMFQSKGDNTELDWEIKYFEIMGLSN